MTASATGGMRRRLELLALRKVPFESAGSSMPNRCRINEVFNHRKSSRLITLSAVPFPPFGIPSSGAQSSCMFHVPTNISELLHIGCWTSPGCLTPASKPVRGATFYDLCRTFNFNAVLPFFPYRDHMVTKNYPIP